MDQLSHSSQASSQLTRLYSSPSVIWGSLPPSGTLGGIGVLGRLTRQPLTAAHVQGPSLGVISSVVLSLLPAAGWKHGTGIKTTLSKDKKPSFLVLCPFQ